jgi:hypothetical protein
MGDDLNFNKNGRQSKCFGLWKTTSMSFQLEDHLSLLLAPASHELGTACYTILTDISFGQKDWVKNGGNGTP